MGRPGWSKCERERERWADLARVNAREREREIVPWVLVPSLAVLLSSLFSMVLW